MEKQCVIKSYPCNETTFSAVCDMLSCECNVPAWPDHFGDAVRNWIEKNRIPPIRTLSLFSGAGGLDIGFSDVGFEIVESVEIERRFCDTLELNSGEGKRFSKSTVNCIDIREFSGSSVGSIEFIIGGPPCQTFSAAGRRANGVLGTADDRGVLFREYVRLLKELSPKGFLFENVYGIIGAQGGEAWKEILSAFSEVGYKLYYRILDAADYGVPQHRERLIIVGIKEGTFCFPRPTHGPDSIDEMPFYNAETAVSGVTIAESEDSMKLGGRYAHLLEDIPPGLNYSFYTEEMGHPRPIFAWRSKFSDFLYKADPNMPVRTIKASGGAYTGPLHWKNRFFSYEEYKRLQTFPDNYQISGNKKTAVKQIGNSVPPQLGRIMAIAIRQQIFGTKFPFDLPILGDFEELSFRKNKRTLTAIYKKKAEMAIASLADEKGGLPDSREYHCSIDANFQFKRVRQGGGNYRVQVTWADDLTIRLEGTEYRGDKPSARITIRARANDWVLGVDRVILEIYSTDTMAFTAAWKAFELELKENAIKADLVQLNGYYQYQPKLICSLEVSGDYPYAHVLKRVVEGKRVAEIISAANLADAWGLETDEVMDAAEYLKSIGYEVRNNVTNPQIEVGNWLIPYSFPTLNNRSVQLWKKIR